MFCMSRCNLTLCVRGERTVETVGAMEQACAAHDLALAAATLRWLFNHSALVAGDG